MRVHLFPSRTQKLSSCTPTILGGRLPGKIGNANTKLHLKKWSIFLHKPNSACKCPPDTCYGRTILGLPRKIGNANTKPPLEITEVFLIHEPKHRSRPPLESTEVLSPIIDTVLTFFVRRHRHIRKQTIQATGSCLQGLIGVVNVLTDIIKFSGLPCQL